MKNYHFSLLSRYRGECMGFAMLVVMIGHSHHFGVHYPGPIAKLMGLGMFSVYIFMILSGLGMKFALKKESEGFLKKRLIRILPSYLIIAVPMLWIIDVVMDGKGIGSYLLDLSLISFWLGGESFWYVAIQLVSYILIPIHDRLRKRFGTWVNAAVLVFSIVIGHVLREHGIESFGTFFQFFSAFIGGYWLADAVEKDTSIPVILVIPMFLFVWAKSFLNVSEYHMLVSLSFALIGLSACILLGWIFDTFGLEKLRKGLRFFGTFTLEGYMMNVSLCWIAWRLKPLWEGTISIHFIYWGFCMVFAMILACAVHKVSEKTVKRLLV